MKNKTKPIRLWLLCLSFLFLFNPNLIVVDILPDFVGYLLLCAALIRLSDLNGTIEEALNGFKKMIFIDGAKWLAIFWIFGISEVDEQTSSMLLWSTVFCILELIFAIPAFSKLFSGFSELPDSMVVCLRTKGYMNGIFNKDKAEKEYQRAEEFFKAIVNYRPGE